MANRNTTQGKAGGPGDRAQGMDQAVDADPDATNVATSDGTPVSATLPREALTIAGVEFQITSPYQDGHTLNAGEAAAMNQLFRENIRNNFAKRIKEASASGTAQDSLQTEIDSYANEYKFGVRRSGGGGGRTSDPVRKEAKVLARNAIIAGLKSKGKSVKDYTPEQMLTAINKAVDSKPEFMEMAKQRVEQQQSLADSSLSDLEADPTNA